jgi:PAS domain S-box-containing protein
MYNAERKITFCNAQATALLGYTSEEFARLSVCSLFEGRIPGDAPESHSPVATRRQATESTVRRKSGESVPVSIFQDHLEIEGEKAELCILHDLTERKRVQREHQKFEVQLRQAQKLESIGQLAAGIAHEINTPTQYIGDNTRFLKDAFASISEMLGLYSQLVETASQATPLIGQIKEASQRLDLEYLFKEIPTAIDQSIEGIERVSKIVRAMKDFSHPNSTEKSSIDINHAIESTITVARNEWKYVATLETDFDAGLQPVMCFPGEFNQVILNLVVNAAHAIGDVILAGGSEKGTIRVSTRRAGNAVEIRISDTGTGIPEAVRPRLFEPFFTTKEVGKGTGQGLAIARSVIVEKHGGTITFETEIGKGTTFIIRLPL